MTRLSPAWGRGVLLGVLLLCGTTGAMSGEPAVAEHISLAEISRGMTGYGLTVFQDARIDTFGVKVVGIQDRVRADGSLILVEVDGHGLELSSIAQGMSGSPVYIDGRFAGALAFGWPGALKPLAGVTPAAEILNLPTDDSHTRTGSPRDPARNVPGLDSMREGLLWPGQGQALAAAALPGEGGPRVQQPRALDLPSGWPSPPQLARQLLAPLMGDAAAGGPDSWFIRPLGLQGPAGGDRLQAPAALRPGSACAVPLITGDAQLGAIGTVTWVDGQDVFMMGHPFMQRGPVNLPLATAEILTVFPSRQLSFKLGSVGRIVGTVHHDQRAGLAGRLGAAPELVPVDLEVDLGQLSGGDGGLRRYSFGVVDDPLLTPTLVFWTLYNGLLVEGDDASGQNLAYTIELHWEQEGTAGSSPLVLQGVTAGPGGAGRLATEWMGPISLLLNNPFAQVRLTGVRASLEVSRPLATATIGGVTAPRALAVAGQDLVCRVEVVPRLGRAQTRTLTLPLPAGLEPGTYRLAIASAAEMFGLEAQRAPGRFEVTSLDGMLELLDTPRAANTLVAALLAPGEAVVLQGEEMAGLPDRVSRVFRSGNLEASPALADIIVRTDQDTPWLLQGHAVRNIRIAPGTEPIPQERRP